MAYIVTGRSSSVGIWMRMEDVAYVDEKKAQNALTAMRRAKPSWQFKLEKIDLRRPWVKKYRMKVAY